MEDNWGFVYSLVSNCPCAIRSSRGFVHMRNFFPQIIMGIVVADSAKATTVDMMIMFVKPTPAIHCARVVAMIVANAFRT